MVAKGHNYGMCLKCGKVHVNPNAGNKFSEESRRKLSESHLGKVPWNIGRKGVQVAWNKGLDKSDPRVAGYVDRLVGRVISENTRRNMSNSKKGVPNLKKRGVSLTKSHKIKLSVAHMGKEPWNVGLTAATDDRVKKGAEHVRGTVHSKESVEKWRNWYMGLPPSERSSRSSHAASFVSTEDRSNAGVQAVLKQKKKGTNIENVLEDILKRVDIEYTPQIRVVNTVVDFFIPPNFCLFADGDYWHNKLEVKVRDEKKSKELEEKGFNVLRFWEHDILKRTEWVKQELQTVLG